MLAPLPSGQLESQSAIHGKLRSNLSANDPANLRYGWTTWLEQKLLQIRRPLHQPVYELSVKRWFSPAEAIFACRSNK
jgi:hypothetical protein